MALSFSSIDRNRYAEPAAALACAAFALLVLWLLVRLVWALVPRSDAALELAPPRLAADAAGAAPAQSVANWHLFGTSRAALGAGGAAPATTLSLILRGTFASADPRAGIAVISGQGGEENAYSVGEEVTPGARLSAVYPDHVVLTHEGAEESLKLPRDRNLTPGDIVQPTPGTATSGRTNNPLGGARATASATSPIGAVPATNASVALQQTIAQMRNNPAELMKRVQVVPVLDGGKLTGVRLSASGDAAVLQQIGLRAGDVVTTVNGLPIDSFARGQEIMNSLKNSSSVHVTVLRDGKPVALTVGLK